MNPDTWVLGSKLAKYRTIFMLKQCSTREKWGRGGEVPRILDFNHTSRSSWDIEWKGQFWTQWQEKMNWSKRGNKLWQSDLVVGTVLRAVDSPVILLQGEWRGRTVCDHSTSVFPRSLESLDQTGSCIYIPYRKRATTWGGPALTWNKARNTRNYTTFRLDFRFLRHQL
jgi:hypothetical protein